MSQRRALVIGGSVGGLFAANLLRQTGWDVTVFERTRGDLSDRGTGIGTREELFTVMRRIGLRIDASTGVQVQGRVGLDRSGTTLYELPVRAVTSGWQRIWQPLRQALPDDAYRGGMTLAEVRQDGGTVTAVFADGSRETGDLLIGADGLHSTVRGQQVPDLKPDYAGYVAWRGVVEQYRLDPTLHDMMLRRMVFGFPPGELMLSIPMPGPQDGPHRGDGCCHFVWFRPADAAALADLCTDASGHAHGVSIPPPLIRPELLDAVRADAERLMAPQLAALVRSTGRIILQPIFDLESPRLVFGRVVLVGDAAFVARPHVATGVMKAALDAERLSDALAVPDVAIDEALSRYDHERRTFGAWLVARGRHIAKAFTTEGLDSEARIATLLREYGAAGVVADEPITVRQLG